MVKTALARRGEPTEPIDKVLELDSEVRRIATITDKLRAERNKSSKDIGNAKRKPTTEELDQMRTLGNNLKHNEEALRAVRDTLRSTLLAIPNLPLSEVPGGLTEADNVVQSQHGETTSEEWHRPHWDIAPQMGLMNMEAGAAIAGRRFYVLSNNGAKLNRALASWMLDVHTSRFGYVEIEPPLLVKREAMIGSGNLPKFADNLYHDEEEDLWLIPTAEVALGSMYTGRILEPSVLPIKFVAHTPCFRKEKAADGREVRGIKRVHQFEKVELFRFEEPSASPAAHQEMLEEALTLCRELGLTYRVMRLCAGDMGFQSAKTYDIEVWAPGSQEWLEVSSVSVCGDFQVRRTNTRYRPSDNVQPQFPHTLNGSGLALPRIWITLVEAGLQPDGSITIPEPLQSYMGMEVIKASDTGA